MDQAILRILLALPAMAAAVPAAAQSLPFGASVSAPYASGKTEAILGGSSRLAAIMAQQSGQAPVTPVQAALPVPASSGYVVRPAVLAQLAPASLEKPDVFGSVALAIKRTPLDRRWRAVASVAAKGHAARYATSVAPMHALAKIDAVNRYVNARVSYINDLRSSGVEDRWSTSTDTLARGKGDCEDYAIAKLQMLRRAGFADRDLYLVVLRDLRRQADHAVLVARADDRLLVLDNGTDRIVDSAILTDYRPIFSFSGNRVWTHGYRRVEPPVIVASAEAQAPAPVVMASAETQGVTMAPAIPAPSAAN